MGQIIEATCLCGFESDEMFVGGGMRNFTTYCGAPALCDSCNALLVLNYLDPASRCESCGEMVRYYDNPELRSLLAGRHKRPRDVFYWNIPQGSGVFSLPDTEYLCPKCGETKMQFSVVGHWD